MNSQETLDETDIEQTIDTLKKLKKQFDNQSNEYADISMTIAYLSDPDYYETELPKPTNLD